MTNTSKRTMNTIEEWIRILYKSTFSVDQTYLYYQHCTQSEKSKLNRMYGNGIFHTQPKGIHSGLVSKGVINGIIKRKSEKMKYDKTTLGGRHVGLLTADHYNPFTQSVEDLFKVGTKGTFDQFRSLFLEKIQTHYITKEEHDRLTQFKKIKTKLGRSVIT